MLIQYIFLSFCLFQSLPTHTKTVEYNLVIAPKTVNITGKNISAFAINDSIPGPTISATVGDYLKIHVTNNLAEDTSLHWHGILLPNRMDGVPYVTTPPLKPGASFTYEFPVKQSGTYWYHSHSILQEQQGLYGALVFHPQTIKQEYDAEHIIVLSDWNDDSPYNVLRNLKKDPDYYALKKDTVQSWAYVASFGRKAIKLRFTNALQRMFPMDISDIGYDAFLMNGNKTLTLDNVAPGKKVMLRIINASSSSYFVLQYSGGPMQVVEADGRPVQPFTTDKLRIAIAETYNIVVTIPDNNAYELRANAEDGTGYCSAYLGSGTLQPAPHFPKPKLALMEHTRHTSKKQKPDTMQHDTMMMHEHEYQELKSPYVTTLPTDQPIRTIPLDLTGFMQRFIWSMNNKPMYATDPIVVKKGENIQLRLKNTTMMHHPIHLHGHFFRVLNGQDDYSPLKHTVNVPPLQTVDIQFAATEEKDWVIHCHNLYHMNLGMMNVVHYEDTYPDPDVLSTSPFKSRKHGNKTFQTTFVQALSHMVLADLHIMRHNDSGIIDLRYTYKNNYEIEFRYQHFFTNFFAVYAGAEFEREKDKHKKVCIEKRGIFGVRYLLPLLVMMDVRVYSDGDIKLEVSNIHQLTKRLSFDWYWNTDKEYTLSAYYAFNERTFFTLQFDSREKWGAGLSVLL